MKEIRRKHFRFPAYDDELGVKLTNDKKRVLFDGQEDLLTEQNQSPFEQMKEFHFTNTNTEKIRRKRRATNGLKSAPRKENLEKHKGKLPDYTGHYQSEITSTGRKKLFGDSSRSVRQSETRTESKHTTRNASVDKKVRERSYFVPKYVPASIIPDPRESKISEDHLIESMKKTDDSYLLFDTEPTPYQEKRNGEPSVRTFNRTKTLEETKQSEEKKSKKSHGILERSLQGLIDDQGNSLGENSYFK
ncbi:TPA: hypothetical protein LP435_001718 [Enterococcus faecium]|nr:hypothetical protein [Enterococcus faecium]